MDRIAGGDLHWDGFAGDRGSVQAAASFPDDAVGSDPFPGAYDQQVTDLEVLRGDLDGCACALNACGLGHELEQGTQARPRAVHGLVLECFGDRVQKRQGGGLLDVPQEHRTNGADRHEQADAEPALREQPPQGPGDEGGSAQQQPGPVQDLGDGLDPGPVEDQAHDQRHTGKDRHQHRPITPPGLVVLVLVLGYRLGCFTTAGGGGHRFPPSGVQQPATGH